MADVPRQRRRGIAVALNETHLVVTEKELFLKQVKSSLFG